MADEKKVTVNSVTLQDNLEMPWFLYNAESPRFSHVLFHKWATTIFRGKMALSAVRFGIFIGVSRLILCIKVYLSVHM